MNTRGIKQSQRLWLVALALSASLLYMLFMSASARAEQPAPGAPPTAPAADFTSSVDTGGEASVERVATPTRFVYFPLIQTSQIGLVVNPQNRNESAAFFKAHYVAYGGDSQEHAGGQTPSAAGDAVTQPPMAWRGNQANCDEGSPSAEFRDAVLHRINYFRAMAGVPADVQFADEFNHKAQKAALMMSANRRLSHSPGPDWTCYSADGAQAAGSSNLYLGVYAWDAVSGYIADPGEGNAFVGHRRWVLYPQTQHMGTGDIPDGNGYPAANALWVFDDNMWQPRPDVRDDFVAWPPAGYTPYQVAFPKWSFSYPDADFSDAAVTMTRSDGSNVALTAYDPMNGFGENTLVWKPDVSLERPISDMKYTIRIDNVTIGGASRTFVYAVTLFDPDA
jgi:uncharacterized protein YkwD